MIFINLAFGIAPDLATLASVARSGAMPNARLMKIIPMVSRGSLVLVLVGIAITTTTG